MHGARRFVAVVAAAAGLLAAGCGGKSFSPVQGSVVHPDGTPATELEGYNVVFEGTAPDGKAYSAVGAIDAAGKFELTTATQGDGAPIGPCKVLIEPKMLDSEREAPYPVHPKYRSFATSELTAEVKPQSNQVTLTIEPRPKKK